VTSLETERVGSALARDRVLDALAGRTVWCAAPLSSGPAERLTAHLGWASERGVRVTWLDVGGGDALQRTERVRRDDVVVMYDALSAALTPPLRELGAHAVWYVSDGTTALVAARCEFLRPYAASIDAYVVSWGGPRAQHLAALMPAPDRVAQKDPAPDGDDLGWSSLLAAVVDDDRADRVGGARCPRPVVAAR
jgi:hypothetical protein